MERPSNIYTPRFLYYYELALATTRHGWFNPFQCFFHLPEACAHCISLYTRDLDAAGYDSHWGLGIEIGRAHV